MANKKLEILIQEAGTQDMLGIEFPINKLLIEGKEIDKGTHIETLNPIEGKDEQGNPKNLVIYYKNRVIDVYNPSVYNQWNTMPMPVPMMPVQDRKGVGPQYDHEVIAYIPEEGKKHTLFHNNDGSHQPEEWKIDLKATDEKLFIKLRNNYEPKRSKTITENLGKLITIQEGEKENLEVKAEEAKGLIDEIGACLGYDYTYDPVYPKKNRNVCAIRRLTENGSTYGYDTIYLVWKDKKGDLKHEEITNSRSTKDYLSVQEIKETKEDILVKVKDYEHRISKKEIGLK